MLDALSHTHSRTHTRIHTHSSNNNSKKTMLKVKCALVMWFSTTYQIFGGGYFSIHRELEIIQCERDKMTCNIIKFVRHIKRKIDRRLQMIFMRSRLNRSDICWFQFIFSLLAGLCGAYSIIITFFFVHRCCCCLENVKYWSG